MCAELRNRPHRPSAGPSIKGFEKIDLDASHCLYAGPLPRRLVLRPNEFGSLWDLHPAERHEIRVHYRTVQTPRWQQAYGKSYVFSGTESVALPIPAALGPLLGWARRAVDARLNGLLLNWYDGALGHYISAHRDSRAGLVDGSPIVTISYGQARVFRLRPYRGRGFVDFEARHGEALVMPYATNLAWTHEVPRLARFQGRRISVTIRAFD